MRSLFGAGYVPVHAVARSNGNAVSALACLIDLDPASAAAVTADRQSVYAPASPLTLFAEI